MDDDLGQVDDSLGPATDSSSHGTRTCRVRRAVTGDNLRMTLFAVIASVVVTIGVVVLILTMEKQRARGIQRDLREQQRPPRAAPDRDRDDPDR